MGTLEIRLFGVLTIERDGRPLATFPSRKVKDLFAYLLLNRQSPHSREYLAALFWPDCESSKARHCLNTALWRLRTALDQPDGDPHPYLRIDAVSIGVNPAAAIRADVDEFELGITRAATDSPEHQAIRLQRAVALYRADLLTECYEDWCLIDRERLQRSYIRALAWLLAYHRGQRAFEQAIEYGELILRCDPLREKTHRDLICMRLEAGDPPGALRQYEHCATVIKRELGTDVMPETRALLAQIRCATSRPERSNFEPSSSNDDSDERVQAAVLLVRQAQEQLRLAIAMLHDLGAGSDVVHELGKSFPAAKSPAAPWRVATATPAASPTIG